MFLSFLKIRWQLTQTKKMWNHQGPKTETGNGADQEIGTVNPHRRVNATALVKEIVLNLQKGNVTKHFSPVSLLRDFTFDKILHKRQTYTFLF